MTHDSPAAPAAPPSPADLDALITSLKASPATGSGEAAARARTLDLANGALASRLQGQGHEAAAQIAELVKADPYGGLTIAAADHLVGIIADGIPHIAGFDLTPALSEPPGLSDDDRQAWARAVEAATNLVCGSIARDIERTNLGVAALRRNDDTPLEVLSVLVAMAADRVDRFQAIRDAADDALYTYRQRTER